MNDIMPYGAVTLPDNLLWEKRFEIRSATSNRVYIIARNKQTQKIACSCAGYRIHRKCKHLIDGCRLMLSQIHGRDHLDGPSSSRTKDHAAKKLG